MLDQYQYLFLVLTRLSIISHTPTGDTISYTTKINFSIVSLICKKTQTIGKWPTNNVLVPALLGDLSFVLF